MSSKKSIVFDLDDTLCYPNHHETDSVKKYLDAKPNPKMILHLRMLQQRGWYIIIHTARRMVTHNGDISKIIEDIGEITQTWLGLYEVPYDELIFGKPYSNTYYVDDKAINLRDFDRWMNETIYMGH